MCGLATPGIVGDLSRRDLRVRDGIVSTLACASCISPGRRRELVAAGGRQPYGRAWLVVASVHDSSVDFFSILTRLDFST